MAERIPKLPSNLPEYGRICLQALADAGLGWKISVGGALGLLHYLDYRPTNDLDAWWANVSEGDRQRVVDTIVTVLQQFGEVRTRSWGDVVSIELYGERGKVFSVQIARRSAKLEPEDIVPGINVLLDSFSDLIASKVVALIERGAPRDFRDIYAVCQAGLITPQECWVLWRRRQALAGSDTDRQRAKLAVETHLERIARHRPLDEIEDTGARAEALAVREWFREVFIHAAEDLLDRRHALS